MAKFYIIGNYTAQAFKGFIKDPKQDRAAAANALPTALDAKISYVGDWTSYNYRKSMQDAGYKNGDPLGGEMFPTLYEAN